MKDGKGRFVVRLGDSTSHGGKVISACSEFNVLGKFIALAGDMTKCPKCKGDFSIQVSSSDRQHHGKAVAYHGDKTGCGATLISSL